MMKLHQPPTTSFLFLLAMAVVPCFQMSAAENRSPTLIVSKQNSSSGARLLNMTLCVDKCQEDCKTYMTPLAECYCSADLFPNDPSWSGLDVYDALVGDKLLRTIFQASSDGSCTPSEDDDRFQIDLNVCVGHFGQPRPWGTFSIPSSDYGDETQIL